ncbi:MAG: S53 family peptidase [Rhizomicrobium sp.]|jgi:subtilase family serine protease
MKLDCKALAFGTALTASCLAILPAGAQSAPQITQTINPTQLSVLAGNTRPEANAANDRGRVADSLPMDNIQLQLKRPAETEQAFESAIDRMYTPGSPSFHHWMTAAQIGTTYGPSAQDVQTITRWLTSHGFHLNEIAPSRMLIDFSGTAGQVRDTFATEIHNLQVDGVRHIANMSDPKIPAAMAPVISGIVSLHDFNPHSMRKPRAAYTYGSGSSREYALVPADLQTIYNLTPLYTAGITGQGETIVTVEDTNLFTTADYTKFRSEFGLSSYTSGSLTTVHPEPASGKPNCTNPGVPAGGDDGEAAVDVEYASAAAPNATVELASCKDTTTFGGLIAIENIINAATHPTIISMSYGECEAENGASANAAFYSAFQQAAAEGVSVFVSAGDEDAASCDAGAAKATHGIGISGWASTPYNVAVGGTDFGDTFAGENATYWNTKNTKTYGSAKSYIDEIPWNDSCASQLITTFNGSTVPYGSTGFCNTANGKANYLGVAGGSGGPSGCATGAPATAGVVSGTCAGYAKPSWQTGLLGNPVDGVRDIPDVSLFAANGVWGHYYVFCWSHTAEGGEACTGAPSGWAGAGGTSFSSPIMAGIQALVQQKTGAAQGNPNPVYYALAATEYGATGSAACNSTLGNGVGTSCIFYDVTQGDMDVNCTGNVDCYLPSGKNGVLSTSDAAYKPAYGTATGWDYATGIGSVNAYNLVNAWP